MNAKESNANILQDLERYFRDPGFDRNTVLDLGNAKCLDEIRDLTVTREAGFAKILTRDAVLGKKRCSGHRRQKFGITRDCRVKEA